MHWIYVIIIGFIAGLIARFIIPGPNNPSGFILTTVLGIVGSLVANFIAEKIGWAEGGEGVSLLSGIVGAVILLLIYHLIARNTATAV
jgi:uncharacterized membrane protein YeaQ/YmgE (transglycosylase-associated protein family)